MKLKVVYIRNSVEFWLQTLITPFNEMPNGRFYDPRSRNSFKYEHLRKEATDIQTESASDVSSETWRKAVQEVCCLGFI